MWTGTETLAHNMLQEYDHPTGRYKISAVYRPLADEQTQRNNTFYVTLNYRCGSNDVVSIGNWFTSPSPHRLQ